MATRKKRASAPRRTSFVFPPEAAAALEAIRLRTYIDDDADVIRIALSVYDNLLHLAELHCAIAVCDKRGQNWAFSPYTRFTYPGLTNATADKRANAKKNRSKNFFFSGEAVNRLDSIRARSETRTNADAIRLALTIFNQLVQIYSAGDHVVVRASDGEESYFNVFNPQSRQVICSRARDAAEAAVA